MPVDQTFAQLGGAAEVAATMAVLIAFQKPPVSIGPFTNPLEIQLDACVRELHHITAHATKHPIESVEGFPATVSDHVIVDPLAVQIDGVISNWPVAFAAALALSSDPANDAFNTLQGDVLNGTLVTISTSLFEYANMVLESVEITRDAHKANALHFTASALQLNIVQMQEIAIASGAPKLATVSGGTAAPAPVKTVPRTSMLVKVAGAPPPVPGT